MNEDFEMVRATIFTSNKSQAVRLPKPVALPNSVKYVHIIELGKSRLISPVEETWKSWFEDQGVDEDFMVEREQPEDQERETL